MTASWNPELGRLTYGKDDNNELITDPTMTAQLSTSPTAPPGADPFAFVRGMNESDVDYDTRMRVAREQAEVEKAALEGMPYQDKPFLGPGFAEDLVRAIPNAGIGFVTDMIDLGLGAVDLGRELGDLATGREFEWRNIMDDSDNPLTQWRRKTFIPNDGRGWNTGFGEFNNLLFRLGGDVVGGKLVFKAAGVGNRLKRMREIVTSVRGLQRFQKFEKVSDAARRVDRLRGVASASTKASKIGKAATRAAKNDYLSTTFSTISKLDDATGINWWKNVVKTAPSYLKDKIRPKTLADTIAWDAFAAFNVMGEGDDAMDETVFDALGAAGINNPLESDPMDSALWRKAKGMFDATLTGVVFGGAVDLIRIKRFQGAFKKASAADKKKLVAAFEESSDEMGRGVARLFVEDVVALADFAPVQGSTRPFPFWDPSGGFGMAPSRQLDQFDLRSKSNPMPGPVDPSVDPWQTGGALVSNPSGALVSRRAGITPDPWEFEQVATARNRIDELDRAEAEAVVGAQKALAGTPSPAGLLPGSDMPNPFPDGKGMVAMGNRIRSAEPTISAPAVRRFSREMLFAGYTPQQVQEAIVSILPRRNVDLIEYMEQGLKISSDGVIDAADSIWSNYILNKGLTDGWARIDPNTAEVTFIRSAAAAADQTDLVTKQAQAVDELEQLRYEQTLQQMDTRQANAGQLDPSVQARLARRDADQTGVPIDVDQATKLADDELAAASDAAASNAEVNAVNSALDADALEADELARVASEITAPNPDEQVRELLGLDPDAIDVTIEKAESGRGWVVIKPDGEPIEGRFTTKRAAQRKANAEKSRLREEMQRRASQVAEDQEGVPVDLNRFDPARDSNLTGKITLTKPQIMELIKYPNFRPIFDQFGVNKKTYEFTQGDMNDFIDGARAMINAGVDGKRARMLKRLIDKFDTSVKLIEPEVRRQREIQGMLDETKRYLDHGDFC